MEFDHLEKYGLRVKDTTLPHIREYINFLVSHHNYTKEKILEVYSEELEEI